MDVLIYLIPFAAIILVVVMALCVLLAFKR